MKTICKVQGTAYFGQAGASLANAQVVNQPPAYVAPSPELALGGCAIAGQHPVSSEELPDPPKKENNILFL